MRNYDWLSRLLLPATAMVIDLSALCAWSYLASFWAGGASLQPLISPWLMLVTITVSALLAAALKRPQLPPGVPQLLSALAAVATVAVILKTEYFASYPLLDLGWLQALSERLRPAPAAFVPELGAIFLALLVWWRGSTLPGADLNYLTVRRRFVIAGVIALAAVIIAVVEANRGLTSVPTSQTEGFLTLTVLAGLAGIAVARIAGLSKRQEDGKARLPLGPWALATVFTLTAMLGVALALAQALSQDVGGALGSALQGFVTLVGWITYPLLLLLGFLAQGLYFLLSLLPKGEQATVEEESSQGLQRVWDQASGGGLSPQVLEILRWSLLGILVAVAIFFAVRALNKRRAGLSEEDVQEEREWVGSWRDSLRAVVSMLLGLWSRLTRQRAPDAPDLQLAAASPAPVSPQARSIRQAYAQMLRLSRSLGRPRAPWQTPHDFLQASELDEAQDDLQVLTEMYSPARYAQSIPPESSVQTALAAWQRLAQRWQSQQKQ